MKENIPANIIGLCGLVLSGLGAVVSAVSFKGSGGYQESLFTGLQYQIPVVSDYGFKFGLTLIILGFLLQILERTEKDGISRKDLVWLFLLGAFIYILILSLQNLLFL